MTPRLAGWIPYRFFWQEGRPWVQWCHLDSGLLTEPSFTQSIRVCLRRPFNLLFRQQTPVETLLEWQERQPGLPPAGFIFHLSRCGSTLIARMLAALPRHVVLSEPDPLDAVLNAHFRDPSVTDAQRGAWLRAMVSALGQRWGGGETHLFIKFDSWHALHLPLIRQVFPRTPWIFVYRDPVEVLVSHKQQPGAQLVPSLIEPAVVGVDLPAGVQLPAEEYCARQLACLCQAALAQYRDGGLLVSYRQLPEAVCTSIADFFGAPCTADEAERMRQVAGFDAKTPQLYFTPDSADKNRAATDLIRQMAEVWVHPLYEQLEAARQAQG